MGGMMGGGGGAKGGMPMLPGMSKMPGLGIPVGPEIMQGIMPLQQMASGENPFDPKNMQAVLMSPMQSFGGGK